MYQGNMQDWIEPAMTEPAVLCANCSEPIEPCEVCGHGYKHVGTQHHSCANGKDMAQVEKEPK